MTHPRKQGGLTFIGLLFLLIIGAFVVLIGLKVTPIYIESFQVDTALENIVSQPDAEKLTKSQIYDKFLRHMEVNEIRRFSEKDLQQMMKIKREGNTLTINMKYETERPLISNLAIIAYWDKEFSG